MKTMQEKAIIQLVAGTTTVRRLSFDDGDEYTSRMKIFKMKKQSYIERSGIEIHVGEDADKYDMIYRESPPFGSIVR